MTKKTGKEHMFDEAETLEYLVVEDLDPDNFYETLTAQVRDITGMVYFTDHCRSKDCWDDEQMDEIETALKTGDGQFFWDKERGSVNFVYNGIVYPFGLDKQEDGDGYFAFVSTCFPLSPYRFESDRFEPLPVGTMTG